MTELVENLKHPDTYCYMQYRSLEIVPRFIKAIDKYIQENYYDKLYEFIECLNFHGSFAFENKLMYFYTQDYFGLLPTPWGSPNSLHKYDTTLSYDDGYKYDESTYFNGQVSTVHTQKYAKYIFNYSDAVLSLPVFVSFIADYCDISPYDIQIELTNDIHIMLPNVKSCVDFVSTFIGNDYSGMPYGYYPIRYSINEA